jgi:CRISPR-associated protein Cas5h
MKAITFELGGKTAMFKKPDVNAYAYFTYNNIHKVALLGILGAMIGLEGYTQLHRHKELLKEKIKTLKGKDKKALQEELKILEEEYPQFYEKLKGLKVSITPLAPHGYFAKKIQVFNNSVGYASKEMGGNLIVREQWLEKPKWQIMILDDESEMYQKLKKYLLDAKCVYIPYLGKNDHPAKISNVEERSLDKKIENIRLSSLFIEECCEISSMKPRGELSSWFKEVSPMRLQKDFHFYEYENFIFTNHIIESSDYEAIYAYDKKNYFFF